MLFLLHRFFLLVYLLFLLELMHNDFSSFCGISVLYCCSTLFAHFCLHILFHRLTVCVLSNIASYSCIHLFISKETNGTLRCTTYPFPLPFIFALRRVSACWSKQFFFRLVIDLIGIYWILILLARPENYSWSWVRVFKNIVKFWITAKIVEVSDNIVTNMN